MLSRACPGCWAATATPATKSSALPLRPFNWTAPGSSAPVLDCPLPRKLLYDIPGLLREAFRDRLALLEDHHISRYLALFAEPSAEICPSQLPTLKLP